MFDVVLVGAGLTGALVAQRLAEAGARCAVVEAGPRGPQRLPTAWRDLTRATSDLATADPIRWAYRAQPPVDWMRVRALGGRTLLWGGWMLRPDSRSLAAARDRGRRWPMRFARLDELIRSAEHRLGVEVAQGGELVRRLRAAGLDAGPKRGVLGPGGKRPLCAQDLLAGVTVIDSAPVVRVLVERGETRGVVALTPDGRSTVIESKRVVLASSAIESARILHETEGIDGGRVGRGLIDHFYCGFMSIVKARAPRGGGPLDRAAFIAPQHVGTGLDFALEVRGPVSLATLDDADLALLETPRAEAERMSYYGIFAIGEMDPTVPRAVRFDGERRDGLGRVAPILELATPSSDERALAHRMRARCGEIAKLLAGDGGTVLQVRDPRDRVLGHEAGTCVMGSRRSGAAADLDGAVHEVRGLYLADASRMPTSLDRHPSLTLAGLALRTAERVLEDLA